MNCLRIILFGVSGVGKSTAAKQLSVEDPTLLHLHASEVLSDALKTGSELLRTASEDAILRNQLLLADALDRRLANISGITILLDGHAVIDAERGLVPVPVEAIAALRPDGMLLLEASPATVLSRRQGSNRPRPNRNLLEIEAQLTKEREVVLQYHQALAVPLVSVWGEPTVRLDQAMATLLRQV